MRIGIVCPYSFDVPGGVQFHVRDLAQWLLARGHAVSVLAPADDGTPVPDYVVPAGRAVPVPYNGSIARLTFGPVSNTRVRRWLSEHPFDVVHVHEPAAPSLSLLALWAATGPVVATFHTSTSRSRAMSAAYPMFFRPAFEKVAARIAVSEVARRTTVEHVGGDAVLIPNGVYVRTFAESKPRPRWRGTDATVAFIGRTDEPRKGLPVLLEAVPEVLRQRPGTRFLVAGRGDAADARAALPRDLTKSVTFLGSVSEADKAALLRTADVYVAPNTGGESFGIVLIEAMASGTPVLASDLEAFRAVLRDGAVGRLFATGDSRGLADGLLALLDDPVGRTSLAAQGPHEAARYDWDVVGRAVLDVYETVAGT